MSQRLELKDTKKHKTHTHTTRNNGDSGRRQKIPILTVSGGVKYKNG